MNALYGKYQTWLSTRRQQTLWLHLLLVLAILFAYWQVGSHEFVNLDTPQYITQNPHVSSGLSRENITWAFTSIYGSNWHPLTWLSHMLDVQLFGLAPGPHNLVNLFLHIVNSLLLFYLFRHMTKAIWPSALVAFLFALHPLHVESVAWVAERKDMLSSCFWMLTLISYCRYVEQPGVKRYLLVLLIFGLGLMTKSMLVTLPFVMLLLDYWPLGRFTVHRIEQGWVYSPSLTRLIGEKVPLFLLSIISSAITLYAQHNGGAISSIESFPFTARVFNSLVAYFSYLGKTFWPTRLAVFYPLRSLPAWQGVVAAMGLLSICFLVFRYSKSRPWLMVGWFWYLGTLVPVIGLLHVGSHALADRYTYIPLIGIFIIIAWSLAELATLRPRLKPVIFALMFVVLVILAVQTKVQVGHWRNSISLYEHAIASTPDNHLAHYNLAVFLADLGRSTEATPYFAEAMRIYPNSVHCCYGYALNLDREGKTSEAERYYQMALQLDINHEYGHEAHVNLGLIQANRGFFELATGNFREALRLDQENVPALFSLGNVNLAQDRFEEAYGYFSEVLRLEPRHAYALCGLGEVKMNQGKLEEAIVYFLEALRLAPEESYIRGRVEYARQSMTDRGFYDK